MSCFWMAGKGPILHADECLSAICVLSERCQKHLQLIVRLSHCVRRAILTLPRQESQIVPSIINYISQKEECREFCKSVPGHAEGIWTERCEAERERLRCCWFIMSTEFSVWAKGRCAEGAFLTSAVWFCWKPERTPANIPDELCNRHPVEVLFYHIPHRSTRLYSNNLKVK